MINLHASLAAQLGIHMRIIVTAVLAAFALAASASAQTAPNPVLEHFRAYRAAIAQGDLTAADTAAAAALAASEARDGDGGRTAVLALNLASLRLERGDRAGALAPATRAHTLATTRGDTNVDTLLAEIVLRRAELTPNRSSRDRLRAALMQTADNADLAGEVYLAAVELGREDLEGGRYEDAVNSAAAWGIAVQTVHAAPGDPSILRARTLTLAAISQLYASARRGRSSVMPSDEAAHTMLQEAKAILLPLATYTPGDQSNEAARALAMAQAWDSVLNARLEALDARAPWEQVNARSVAISNPCPFSFDFDIPAYPHSAEMAFRVGALVVALHTDRNGDVILREVLAAAPATTEFSRAVEASYGDWSLSWRDDPPADCQRDFVYTRVLRFVIEP